MVRLVLGGFFLSGLLLFCEIAQADDSRPLSIKIIEIQPTIYKVRRQVPPSVPLNNIPTLLLPDNCLKINASEQQVHHQRSNANGQSLYRCEKRLAGMKVFIQYPAYKVPTSSLIQYQVLSGESHTALLAPQETVWQIPKTETTSGIAKDYTWFGIYHIWAGIDHLLFLMCLVWIAGSLRRILLTVTGFTLAHSITLGMSALGIIQVPVAPTEVVIALSILFLAVEITKGKHDSITWRYPVAVSSTFGLLHGLGFAAVLNDIGLPKTQVITGLLFFNVGVEIGQVLFILTVIIVIQLGHHWHKQWRGYYPTTSLQTWCGYSIGTIASFWLLERSVPVFTSMF